MSVAHRGPCEEGQVRGAPAPDQPLSAARKRWILVATVLGSSLTFIDGSALGVALPAIQNDLGAGPAAVQWVSNAYLLTLGALVLIGGAAGDRFGRRKVFLIGVALFALASIACGLAPTVELLIAGRAGQGIGAAMLPFAVIMGLFSGYAGRLADRFGAQLSLGLGPVLAGVGLALLALPAPGAGYVDGPLAGMTVLAVGMTLAVGPLTAAVMGAVPQGHTGVASGINNAVARDAALLAIALLGVILSAVFVAGVDSPDARALLGEVMGGADLEPAARDAFHAAFRAVILTCAGLAVLSGVIGGLTAPGRHKAE